MLFEREEDHMTKDIGICMRFDIFGPELQVLHKWVDPKLPHDKDCLGNID